jgi:hypothetical protein
MHLLLRNCSDCQSHCLIIATGVTAQVQLKCILTVSTVFSGYTCDPTIGDWFTKGFKHPSQGCTHIFVKWSREMPRTTLAFV